jgi:hypothetical protein
MMTAKHYKVKYNGIVNQSEKARFCGLKRLSFFTTIGELTNILKVH